MPWRRHTTIGVAQISHSAIQHTSSSWNQGVMRAASHRGQSAPRLGRRSRTPHRSGGDGRPPQPLPVPSTRCRRLPNSAGTGYVVAPTSESAPGVLVLHSWWGLTPFFRSVCDRLADEGFVALAPDLHGDNRTADRPDEAEALLASTDPNVTANLVLAGTATLRSLPVTPDGPIGMLGFSMGASWALWASARAPDYVAAVVGVLRQPGHRLRAGHARPTRATSPSTTSSSTTTAGSSSRPTSACSAVRSSSTTIPAPATGSSSRTAPAAYVEAAADLAWERTVAFLHDHLDGAA